MALECFFLVCGLPVNVDSIFPSRTWLIDKGLGENIVVISCKLVEAPGAVVFIEAFVEE